MDKKIINNYIYNALYQVLILLVPFVTTPYISRMMSVNEIGIYDYSLTICTYFIFFSSLGLPTLGQKKIAIAMDDQQRSLVFNQVFFLRIFSVLIFYIIYCLFIFIFFSNKIIYIFQSIGIIATVFDISWYYSGIEEFKKITNRNILIKIFSIFLLFCFVKGEHILIKYIISITLPNLVGNISMFYKLGETVTFIKYKKKEIIMYLKQAMILLLPSLAIQLSSIIHKTILGMMSDMTNVGYYSQAYKIINILVTIVFSIGTVILPRIILYYSKKDYSKVKELMKDVISFIIHISLPIIFGLLALCGRFVPWFYGDKYNILLLYIPLMTPLILLSAMNNILGNQLLIAMNREKQLIAILIFGCFVSFLLDVILIARLGCLGAIISSLVSEICVCIILYIVYFKRFKELPLSLENYKSIIASIIMFTIILFIQNRIHFNTFLHIILLTLIGLLIYIIFLIIFKDRIVLRLFFALNRHKKH